MASPGRKPESVEAMFERLSILEPTTRCHIWQGKIGTGGYAYIAYREGEPINGHRKRTWRKAATVALELSGRPRPNGLEASHICPSGVNRACVNPDHLTWETHSENLARREWTPKGQRYVQNCKWCGKPKEYKDNWSRPGWYCPDFNRKEHRRLVT